jgi:hypothetical protein
MMKSANFGPRHYTASADGLNPAALGCVFAEREVSSGTVVGRRNCRQLIMAATARLIVMMEKDEKAALDAQAEAAQVSTAEFVRRRLFGRERRRVSPCTADSSRTNPNASVDWQLGPGSTPSPRV